jgi:toxin ParE1/3/4
MGRSPPEGGETSVNRRLDFHPLAYRDLDQSFAWYEAQRVRLGSKFLEEVDRVLARILADPSQFGFAELNIREASLNRFPFVVYFSEIDEAILVSAVHHTSRNPSHWRRRL